MMAKKISTLIVFVLLLVGTTTAQKFKEKRAQKHFDRLEYALAAPLYETLAETNPSAQNVYMLAQCYQYMNKYEKALENYTILENTYPDTTFYYVNYGLLLKAAGEYQHAKNVFKQFLLKEPQSKLSEMVLDLVVSCEKADLLSKNKLGVYVKPTTLNTEYNDFASDFFSKNTLLFSSSRKSGYGSVYKYDQEAFLQVYKAEREEKEVFGEPELMEAPFNGSYHDGPVLFSPRFSAAFITRNDESFDQKNSEYKHHLNIYYANLKEGKWEDTKPFQHNTPDASEGHAAITPSGKYFFFASNRKGGFGETDLYMCTYTPTGWSYPVNMGELVNTPGQEMFPYAYNDSILYFSSDRLIGLGELDVFKAIIKNGEVDRVENLGAPINSNKDDFGFYVEHGKEFQGYFSSNREGGKGGDDIYFFKKSDYTVKALVVDSVTYDPIPLGDVKIRNNEGDTRETFTNRRGKTTINLGPGDQYVLSFSKTGYRVKRLNINTEGLVESKDTALIVELVKGNSVEFDALVVDETTQFPIPIAAVSIDYVQEGYHEDITTTPNGEFEYIADPEEKMVFKVSHPGYFSKTVPVEKHQKNPPLTIELTPIELNKPIEIEPIYYEFDKWNITPQAEVTLNKIVTIMSDNPNITIELSSHTDIRGTDNYNYDLSIKRAQEAIKYLVANGIQRIRLTYKVYGEKKVAIPCPPNVDCDEDVHQKNRRTEFRVTSF